MKRVVFGFLGNVLDQRGKGKKRWARWRPTIDLCRHTEQSIDRLELLCFKGDHHLAGEVLQDIKEISPKTEVNIIKVNIKDPWDFEEVYTFLLDIAQNYKFDLEQEEYGIHITTGTHVVQICWFLLAESRFFPARLIQTAPPTKDATEALIPAKMSEQEIIDTSPIGSISLVDLNLTRYDQILTRFQQYAAQATDYLKSGIATRNAVFNCLIDEIEQVATRSHAPILLEGPTGAGKSFLAKRIYQLKVKQHQLEGVFVEVNCATLRGDSAMSTLFGHVKGAFTGADKERAGLLRQADGGMLFLDEIGELGLDEQAMLLKAIEEKKFYPFGADKEVSSHFQLIAGTNRNLREEVAKGRFREDLYERINLWAYCLPGLAERKEDIEPNIEYELARFAKEYGQMPRFNKEAREKYLNFATSSSALWRGNFRELTASITRMATLAEQSNINIQQVEHEITRLQRGWTTGKETHYPLIPQSIDLFDACQLEKVIAVCRQSDNLSDAGRQLFAVSRSQKQTANDADRLRKYLAKFDLNWEQIKSTC